MIKMTEELYHRLRDDYSGICLKCWTVRHGNTEPDASGYECDYCGASAVEGIDNIVLAGWIQFDENIQKPFVTLRNKKTMQIVQKAITL